MFGRAEGLGDDAGAANQRAAALVRIRFRAVCAESPHRPGTSTATPFLSRTRRSAALPSRAPRPRSALTGKLSPPSGKITTITESGDRLRYVKRRCQVGAARDTDKEPAPRQLTRQLEGVLRRDAEVLIGKRRLIDAGHNRRFHMLQAFEAVQR